MIKYRYSVVVLLQWIFSGGGGLFWLLNSYRSIHKLLQQVVFHMDSDKVICEKNSNNINTIKIMMHRDDN